MTKTNTRRRVVSVLLALVMLVSLMPSLVVPAHAFWDDYDTGQDCEYRDGIQCGNIRVIPSKLKRRSSR